MASGNAFDSYGSGNLLGGSSTGSSLDWKDIGSGIGSMIGGLGQKNLFNGSNEYLKQIMPLLQQMYQPYVDKGQGALNKTYDEYGKLINDPSAMYNKIASGYTQSPGYQFNLQQGTNGINNAAAAGGFIGSPAEQQQMGQMSSNLASQDFNNYMGQATGLYNTGLSGMNGVSQQGFNASQGIANGGIDAMKMQAALKYAQTMASNQSSSGLLGGLGSLLGGAVGSLGGKIGSKIAPFFGL